MGKVIQASAHEGADLIPVRMCNELVYCPRLFHLEHVQGVFVHSADTIEGAGQHERAKRRGNRLRVASADAKTGPAAIGDIFAAIPRKLQLASEQLGVRGTIDLVEVDHDRVVVVEAKHGKAPRSDDHAWEEHRLPYGAWPADVAQVALYIGLLREAGLPCDEARIHYRGSRRSATVPWSADLERFAHAVVARAREVAVQPVPPAPLMDSPKCPGCSLHEVCLPDEHHALRAEREREGIRGGIRKIVASLDEGSVVHVMTPGATVRKDGDALVIADRDGGSERVLAKDVSHLALFGPVHVTTPCLQHMLRSGVGVSHHTSTGRLLGLTAPLCTRNIGLRRAQYRAADDPSACLEIARALVIAKLRNQRTVLRRHRRGLSLVGEDATGASEPADPPDVDGTPELDESQKSAGDPEPDPHRTIADALRRIRIAIDAAQRSTDIDALRGHEGDAAARYFATFPLLLPWAWKTDFCGRSRRPPRDRVNAMLSFGYSLLTRDAVSAAARVGLDPMLGLFHTMIPGRPALALDLIEPFRAAWVDTAVLRLVGTGGITRDDFHLSAAGVELSDRGRRQFTRAYERRAAELTTHPRFGYRMSYRRLLELEARILAKVLLGELEHHTPMWTR
jgi:CRISPR-associated protein Cas1